jgi:hypothetical protein
MLIWTGTAAVENGSATVVVDTGSALTHEVAAAGSMVVLDGTVYFVASLTDTFTLELTRDYVGDDATVPMEIWPVSQNTTNLVNLSQVVARTQAQINILDKNSQGLFFTMKGSTGSADPGPGFVAFDDGDPALASEAYVDVLDANGRSVSGLIALWEPGTTLIIRSLTTTAYRAYTVTANNPSSGYAVLSLAYLGHDGVIADNEALGISWSSAASGLEISATGNFEDRENYDGEPAGFVFLSADGDGDDITVAALFRKSSGATADWGPAVPFQGPKGDKGWAPVYGVVVDGERRVEQLVEWVGGAGIQPTAGVGKYRGAEGLVYDIENATDVRGPTGDIDGVTTFWQNRITNDTTSEQAREGIGAGTGDVVGPSSATNNRLVTFNGTTGKLLKDGGASIHELRMDARPNISVNGSLIDSQENGDTLGTANGYFYADQHAIYKGALGVSAQRVAYTSLAGGRYAAELKCTTAKTALGAADLVTDSEPIEGSRPEFVAAGWGAAGAKQFVHRKEVQKPAGTYSIHVTNSAGNRHCWVPYTVTADEANQKVVKEVIIPGDAGGTWLKGDGQIGMVIDDVLAAGSTYVGGTEGVWGESANYAGAGQKNFLDSTSNVARHTDFGVRLDPDATGVYGRYVVGEADPFWNCYRYVQKSFPAGTSPAPSAGIAGAVYFSQIVGAATTQAAATVKFDGRMAKTPNIAIYNPEAAGSQIRRISSPPADWSSTTIYAASDSSFGVYGTTPSGSALGASTAFHWTANARLS